jgi:hemerythrin
MSATAVGCSASDISLHHDMTSIDDTGLEIAWRNGLSLGDAGIDFEHRLLVQRVNELNAGLVARLEAADILRLMHQLLDVAAAHFANEERLLRDRGYPEAEQHHLVHEALIADLIAAMDKFADTPVSLTWLARGLNIPRTLMEHLAHEDMKYRDWIQSE